MTYSADRLRYLLNLYLQRQCTHAEMDELLSYATHADGKDMLGEMMTVMYGLPDLPEADAVDWDFMFEQVMQTAPPVVVMQPASPRVRWWRYAAAAVLIGGMLTIAWFMFLPGKKEVVVQQTSSFGGDVVAPVINKATLTLADGRRIVLDSVDTGKLPTSGTVTIEKQQDGQLVYRGGGQDGKPRYNTLYVPKGSRPLQLTLSDGTKVWLNVASGITYPETFSGTERVVKITGEAYFEVASVRLRSGQKRPFIVNVDGKASVEVLGTHFNINSYGDEGAIKTTLLEGKVKVSLTGSRLPAPDSRLLAPGEQAIITDRMTVTNQIDVEQVMAWKNGRFVFSDASLESILRQAERWYDVKVEYHAEVPSGFVATISRDVPISKLLKLLQLTGQVNFKIEGKKIIVLPR